MEAIFDKQSKNLLGQVCFKTKDKKTFSSNKKRTGHSDLSSCDMLFLNLYHFLNNTLKIDSDLCCISL